MELNWTPSTRIYRSNTDITNANVGGRFALTANWNRSIWIEYNFTKLNMHSDQSSIRYEIAIIFTLNSHSHQIDIDSIFDSIQCESSVKLFVAFFFSFAFVFFLQTLCELLSCYRYCCRRISSGSLFLCFHFHGLKKIYTFSNYAWFNAIPISFKMYVIKYQ